jgi:hypothetical protein
VEQHRVVEVEDEVLKRVDFLVLHESLTAVRRKIAEKLQNFLIDTGLLLSFHAPVMQGSKRSRKGGMAGVPCDGTPASRPQSGR